MIQQVLLVVLAPTRLQRGRGFRKISLSRATAKFSRKPTVGQFKPSACPAEYRRPTEKGGLRIRLPSHRAAGAQSSVPRTGTSSALRSHCRDKRSVLCGSHMTRQSRAVANDTHRQRDRTETEKAQTGPEREQVRGCPKLKLLRASESQRPTTRIVPQKKR